MSLLKLPFLLITIWSLYVLHTAPNSLRPEKSIQQPVSVPITGILPIIYKWTLISFILLDTTFTIFPHHTFPRSAGINPKFLLGCHTTLLGTLLRTSSYRALGNQFTFELGTNKDHKLITTGPYSIVRHPSYTAVLIAYLGYLIVLSSFEWVPWGVWVLVLGMVVFSVRAILGRVAVEDEMLRREFGDGWERWRGSVRYRLVPGVY